jgi:prepilin-type N-terminal cleavage/methylation domain-containing protein
VAAQGAQVHSSILRKHSGVSLLELIIVLTIIAIMVTMLLPAVHMVRQASRITACQNNLYQLTIGMQGYIDVHRFIPGPPIESHPSGWAIELLPFVEEIPLRNSFNIFICPETEYRPSTTPGVEVTNYLMMVDMKDRPRFRRNRFWRLQDAPEGARFPWCLSPEKSWPDEGYAAPHPIEPFGF